MTVYDVLITRGEPGNQYTHCGEVTLQNEMAEFNYTVRVFQEILRHIRAMPKIIILSPRSKSNGRN